MIRVQIEPIEIWAGKFPVRFTALNAAVRCHLQSRIQNIRSVAVEHTAGFIRYVVTFNELGDLGEVCIRELPDEQYTALTICAPKPSRPIEWTSEEKALIESQPDRQCRLEVAHELGAKIAAEREEVLNWQQRFFSSFLEELLDDSEIINALRAFAQHENNLLDLNQVFRGYNKISEATVGEEDIELLIGMDDAQLRQHICKLIIDVDPVILRREAQKPHGGFEISDMEIPFRTEGRAFYLCIPVKSGREIRGKTVPERWAFQILRPFLNFDSCVVVFISAKKCSQPLWNYIKRTRDKTNWNIQVIEGEELAKLFKVNSLL